MRNRVRLSKKLILETSYSEQGGGKLPGGGYRTIYLWDLDVNGLGLRIFPSGRKNFVLRYPNPKKPTQSRFMTLGEFPALTLYLARRFAEKLRADIIAGGDPAHERRRPGGRLFRDLAVRYLEYSKKNKRSYKDDRSRAEKYLIPAFGDLQIEEITRRDVVAVRDAIGSVVANRVLALLSAMFGRAREWELIAPGHPSPTAGVGRFAEHKRSRVLSGDELSRLLRAADEHENPFIAPFIRLQLLTGARKGELLALKWDQVDMEARRLMFIHTKSGRDHVIRPSRSAFDVLRELRKLVPKESPYVFPGRRPGAHRKNFRNEWKDILETAGIKDLRFHDLRRTAGTWLGEDGVSQFEIMRVLGHSQVSATEHYVHLSGEATAGPLERLGERLKKVEGS